MSSQYSSRYHVPLAPQGELRAWMSLNNISTSLGSEMFIQNVEKQSASEPPSHGDTEF